MNFPNLFIQENMGIWNSWAKIHHWGVHRAGQGCARKAPHWWVGGDREQMVSGNVSGVNNADILGCVSFARWSCVHAVDTNTKCLVHLKSLSLPYMGETQSPSPCWKHHQTDCQCTAVADILLWWRAAILALHLPAWLPYGCVRIFVSMLGVPHLLHFPACRKNGCFLTLEALREVGVSFSSTAWPTPHSKILCKCVVLSFKNCADMETCDFMTKTI